MEERLRLVAKRETEPVDHELSSEPNEPPGAVMEPTVAGGDPPCWAHMLDEEGRLSEP